ncbi:MAG: hypothetical protein IZT55_01685 [Anaerolineae bacterium]|nr:hypothetical protein [Anaerolineae bacterium]
MDATLRSANPGNVIAAFIFRDWVNAVIARLGEKYYGKRGKRSGTANWVRDFMRQSSLIKRLHDFTMGQCGLRMQY